MGFVRISLALHEDFEETRAAGFQPDDRVRHAMIRIGGFLVLHMREGNNQRRQSFDDSWIFDDRRHRDVRHLEGLDAGHALHAFQHRFQRRNVCFEVCFLLIEEHVLSCEHDFRSAFARIDAHAFHDVLKRERTADFCRWSAELTTATTASGNLNYAKGRAMLDHGNLFDRRLHFLGHLDDPLERWIAGHHALEEIAEDSFDLAIDQIIDVELIKAVSALQLPGAGAADDDFRSVFINNWMLYNLQEFGRVYRNQILSGDL